MGYGARTRLEFAQAYARTGNATHALREVLGKERAERMTPHSLRARASELLNDYRTDELIEQFKAEMVAEGVALPHYRGRTYRTDLMSEQKKDRPAKLDILNTETERRSATETVSFGTNSALIARLERKLLKRTKRRTKGIKQ
ncbi:hypothetical protein [Frederiksenia canicola]